MVGTEVKLGYSMLHRISGFLSAGCHVSDCVRDNGEIIQAFNAIACEAGQGNRG